MTFLTWAQDALITKNAYCLAFMEEKLTPEIERYEGQSEEQVTLLLEDDVEVVASEQHINEDQQGPLLDPILGTPITDPMQAQLAVAAYEADGQEPQFAPVFMFDIEIKRVNIGLSQPSEEKASELELGKNVCALSDVYTG